MFCDERLRPDRLEQIVLQNYLFAVLDEHEEDVEGLRLQRNRFRFAQQLPMIGIKPIRTELVQVPCVVDHSRS